MLVIRPLWVVAVVLAATVVFGSVAHVVTDAVWPDGVAGTTAGGTSIDDLAGKWVLIPGDAQTWNRIMYVVLVGGILWLTVLKGWKRLVVLVPVLYLAVSIWESAMLPQPAVARYILIGAMLVGMMAVRPRGSSAANGWRSSDVRGRARAAGPLEGVRRATRDRPPRPRTSTSGRSSA